MFSKSKCVQNISLVVVGTFTLHNIVKLKKETRIGKKNTEISYCDSSSVVKQYYKNDLSNRNSVVHNCLVNDFHHQERNIIEERSLRKPTFVLTHQMERSSTFQNISPIEEEQYQNPVVLSVRRSGRRDFSKQEALRAEECIEALEILVSDFRRTFVGLEDLQLNSFDVTISDVGYDNMYTSSKAVCLGDGEELRGYSDDFTTVQLGNYSHVNNKLSTNIRAHLMLRYPMYQSTHDLGFELDNAEQKLLKKQLLELEMYNNVDMLTKNQSSIAGRSSESVLRHELGHAIQFKILGIANHLEQGSIEGLEGFNDAGIEWSTIYDTRKGIAESLSKRIEWGDKEDAKKFFLRSKIGEGVSVYGGSSQVELFAESWTIYSHPSYGKTVKPLPADIHNFFVKYLPRK